MSARKRCLGLTTPPFKGQRLITQSGSTVVIQDRVGLEKLVGA